MSINSRHQFAILVFLFVTPIVGCSYRAGSFEDSTVGSFPGTRLALPCLDLAVAMVHTPSTGPVLQYSFGNRCRSPITIDLSAVRVTARDRAGVEVALRPHDPMRELRPLPLDGLLAGSEQLLYLAPAPMFATSICVDVSQIASVPGPSQPVCLMEAGTEVQL